MFQIKLILCPNLIVYLKLFHDTQNENIIKIIFFKRNYLKDRSKLKGDKLKALSITNNNSVNYSFINLNNFFRKK